MNVQSYIEVIKSISEIKPKIGIVLGSGLGDFVKQIKKKCFIKYNSIPKFPVSTVKGHEGQFILGYINEIPIICAQGRFHLYEGYDFDSTALPIDIFKLLGCNTAIITNAAGCMNQNWELGSLMLITKCIDFTFQNSSDPKIYFDKNNLVNEKTNKIIDYLSNSYPINKGTYSWVLGPTYETPSEIKKIKGFGGDVVGMSTMPEIIKAKEYNMNVIGLSCISNYASGISPNPLTHQDVLDEVNKSKNIFTNLLLDIIKFI